ncbi:MAG: hypothetical protein ABIN91_15360 [Mucilaginibacter sp.]|uniref:hypothetical protein n=1 Tax=Mucilaginibacter sp. TaxID=1882438 RepID=UPI0032630026
MKTYQTNKTQSATLLAAKLRAELPLAFDGKINTLAQLNILEKENNIEIWLPAPYQDYLYKIEIDGVNVNISKSEHYTDDVNSLAMEDVLMDIIIDFIGKENIEAIAPSA